MIYDDALMNSIFMSYLGHRVGAVGDPHGEPGHGSATPRKVGRSSDTQSRAVRQ